MRTEVEEVRRKLMDIVDDLDRYEREDTRYTDWYISAKEHIYQADSELSYILYD